MAKKISPKLRKEFKKVKISDHTKHIMAKWMRQDTLRAEEIEKANNTFLELELITLGHWESINEEIDHQLRMAQRGIK